MAIRWIGSDLPDARHLLQISATSGHHPHAAAPAKNDAEENASCLAWFAASMLPSRKHKLAENVDFRLRFEQENMQMDVRLFVLIGAVYSGGPLRLLWVQTFWRAGTEYVNKPQFSII